MQIIVFALSKRQCEELAGHLSTMDLNAPDEAELVDRIFWSAMDVLSVEDRRLPQICAALPMLRRGVGVHHSGLLPIVKEAIEVLFGEGLIKVRSQSLSFLSAMHSMLTAFHHVPACSCCSTAGKSAVVTRSLSLLACSAAFQPGFAPLPQS